MSDKAFQDRVETRTPIESIIMPFLGSRVADSSPFQYLIQDLSPHGGRILLPKWVLKRENLRVGDQINFHLPFIFDGEAFAAGKIVWSRYDEEFDAPAFGVRIDARAPAYYPVTISMENLGVGIDLAGFKTSANLLARVFKDSILLKKGILIYLKHLKPLACRIVGADVSEMEEVRSFFFDDTAQYVHRNIKTLELAQESLLEASCSGENMGVCLDLEQLRAAMEPEIITDVWNAAFGQKIMAQYISAINHLEHRLFYNYNTIVMVYISGMS